MREQQSVARQGIDMRRIVYPSIRLGAGGANPLIIGQDENNVRFFGTKHTRSVYQENNGH
jgi:hypothetical protein